MSEKTPEQLAAEAKQQQDVTAKLKSDETAAKLKADKEREEARAKMTPAQRLEYDQKVADQKKKPVVTQTDVDKATATKKAAQDELDKAIAHVTELQAKVNAIVVPQLVSTEKLDVHEKIVNILKEYDNKETDIPVGHEYWGLLNQHRGMK